MKGDLIVAIGGNFFEVAVPSFARIEAKLLPVSKSHVHLTSLAVNGSSCHLTPLRNGMVSSVPSSFHDQPVARSGTIDPILFCATC